MSCNTFGQMQKAGVEDYLVFHSRRGFAGYAFLVTSVTVAVTIFKRLTKVSLVQVSAS
jgi:hypothetical protein